MDRKERCRITEKQFLTLLCCVHENMLTDEEFDTIIGEYRQVCSDNLDEAVEAFKSFSARLSILKYKLFARLQEKGQSAEDDCCNKK